MRCPSKPQAHPDTSRFQEEEADPYGSHSLFNAGYDPAAMSSVFRKMYKVNPNQPVKFLSTHPPMPDRVESITEYLESLPQERELKCDSHEFQGVRQKFAAAPQPPGGAGPPQGQGALPPP